MLKSFGTISTDTHRVVLDVSLDFVRYYQWFITKEYWVVSHLPKFGAHISIASDRFNKEADFKKARKYHGERVEFEYGEDVICGGRTKGFYLFYVKVYSEAINSIKRDIGVIDPPTYQGLHLSIAQMGKSGAKLVQWWPEMISFKH